MASCQMNLKGKLVGETQVRSSGDLFQLFAIHPYKFSKICPSLIRSCHVEKGEFGKNGSLVVWNYFIDGKPCVVKDMVMNMDTVNKSFTYKCIEGDVLNMYKTMLIHLHVIPQGKNCNLVRWTFEYEKLNEEVPQPTFLLDFVLDGSKRIEGYNLNA